MKPMINISSHIYLLSSFTLLDCILQSSAILFTSVYQDIYTNFWKQKVNFIKTQFYSLQNMLSNIF